MNHSTTSTIDLSDLSWKEFHPDFESLVQMESFIEQEMEEAEIDMRSANKINISVDEILTNIVSYSQAKTTKILCLINETQIKVLIQDDGIPYNPLLQETPDVHLSLEERKIGGLGIFMAKKLLDDFQYQYNESKNITILIVNRKK